MSTLAILIDTHDRTPQVLRGGNISLSWRLGGRGESTFDVYSADGSYIPECGHDVQWFNASGVKIWGGIVLDIKPTALYKSTAAGVPVVTKCHAVTYEQCLDKRMVAIAVYENKTCKEIISDIFTSKLPEGGHVDINAWGVTVQTGVTITRYVIDHARVSDILDDLAARSGYAWWVGKDKELYFCSRATSPGVYFAPFSITDAAPNVRELSISSSLDGYRNRQHIRVSYAAGNKASQTIVGDGVAVQWTLYNPNLSPPEESLINYIESVKVTTGSPASERDASWGTDGIDTDKEFYFLQGGSYVRHETSETILALTSDQQLTVEWRQLGDDVMTVENGVAVAVRATIETTTGIYENLIDNSSEIDQLGHLAKAWAVLNAKSVMGTVVEGVTDHAGLYPGMVLDIATSTPPISSSVLIDTVDASYLSNERLRYSFHGSTAAYDDWIALWDRALSTGTSGIVSGASSSQSTITSQSNAWDPPGLPTLPAIVVNDLDLNFGLTTAWAAPIPLGSVVGYDREVIYYSDVTALTAVSDWIPLGSVGAEVITADSGPWPRPAEDAYVQFRVRSYNGVDVRSEWVLSELPPSDVTGSGLGPPTSPDSVTVAVLDQVENFGLRTSWTTPMILGGTIGWDREVRYYLADDATDPVSEWISLGSIGTDVLTADSGFWPRPSVDQYVRLRVRGYNSLNAKSGWTESALALPLVSSSSIGLPVAPTSPVVTVLDQGESYGLRTAWTEPGAPGGTVGYDREVRYYSNNTAVTAISDWIPLGSVGVGIATADSGPWPRLSTIEYVRFRVRGYNGLDAKSAWVDSATPLPAITPTAAALLPPVAPTSPTITVWDQTGNFGLTTAWTEPGTPGGTVGYDREVRYYSNNTAVTAISDWIPLGSVGLGVATADSGPWPRPVTAYYIRFRVRGYNGIGEKTAWVLSATPLPAVAPLAAPATPATNTSTIYFVTEGGIPKFGFHLATTSGGGTTAGYRAEARYYSDAGAATPTSEWIYLGGMGTSGTPLDAGPWPRPGVQDYAKVRIAAQNADNVLSTWLESAVLTRIASTGLDGGKLDPATLGPGLTVSGSDLVATSRVGLSNGDFEQGFKDWTNPYGAYVLETTGSFSGTNHASLTNTAGNMNGWRLTQTFNVIPGQTYKLSGYAKSTVPNVAALSAYTTNKDTGAAEGGGSVSITAASWAFYTITFAVPANNNLMKAGTLGLGAGVTGVAYFDQLTLELVEAVGVGITRDAAGIHVNEGTIPLLTAPPAPATNTSTIYFVAEGGIPKFGFHLATSSGGGTTAGYQAQARYYTNAGATTPEGDWIDLASPGVSQTALDAGPWPRPTVQDYAKIRIAARNADNVLSTWLESAILTRIASTGVDAGSLDPTSLDAGLYLKDGRLQSAVGNVSNMVGNPGFEDDLSGWTVLWSGTMSATTAEKHSGLKSALIGPANVAIGQSFPVRAGETYYYEVWYKFDAEATGFARIGVLNYDAAGDLIGNQLNLVTPTTTWTKIAHTVLTEANSVRMLLCCLHDNAPSTGNIYLDEVLLVKEIPTEGIADGAVTGPKVEAGSLVTSKFASTIRPVSLLAAAPGLPNALYPAGSLYYNTTDGKLYRVNAAGTGVQKAITGDDVVANSIVTGNIAAGAIRTEELYAGEILVGGGGGKPTRFRVNDAGGGQVAFIGDNGAGFIGGYLVNLRVGPDINAPVLSATSSGVAVTGQLHVYSAASPVGWIGTDGTNTGAWFKKIWIGGTSVATAKIVADVNGAVTITGASITVVKGTTTTCLNPTSGLTISDSTTNYTVTLNSGYLRCEDTGGHYGLVNPYRFSAVYGNDNIDYVCYNGTVKLAMTVGTVLKVEINAAAATPYLNLVAGEYQVSGVAVINSNKAFVGAGVFCTTAGVGGTAFAVYSGGWIAGVTGPTTFTTVDGKTVTVRGGIVTSIV